MRSPLARKTYWLAVLVIVLLAASGAIAGIAVLPTVVFALIVLAFATAWARATDRKRTDTAPDRERDAVPSTPFIEDDETPLGATTEQHEEISPHDLPPGHPGRAAAEAQAAESKARGGEALTTGDVEDRPEVVRDDGLRKDRGGEQDPESERRLSRGDVAWTAEEQERGQVRGPRSSR
jgi:hypothetical protein